MREFSLLRGPDPILAAPNPRLPPLLCSPLSVLGILNYRGCPVPPLFRVLHICRAPSLAGPLDPHALLSLFFSSFWEISSCNPCFISHSGYPCSSHSSEFPFWVNGLWIWYPLGIQLFFFPCAETGQKRKAHLQVRMTPHFQISLLQTNQINQSNPLFSLSAN